MRMFDIELEREDDEIIITQRAPAFRDDEGNAIRISVIQAGIIADWLFELAGRA